MKTITIKSNGLGRYDDVSPFIMANNKLELKVDLPKVNGEFFLIGENNGKTIKRELSRAESVELDGLSAGELNLEVKHYLKGVLIKTYSIEPLMLREVDTSLSGTPEIIALNTEIAQLKQTLAEEQRKAQEREKALTEREEKINAKVAALIRFAFSDYQNNVYLGGGSAEEFIKEYGFDLTEAEIKSITGGKVND